MFFLTDLEAQQLPKQVVLPAIPTLKRFTAKRIDKASHAAWGDEATRRWLLAIPPDRVLSGQLQAYVEQYEEEVRHRYLVAQHRPWYSITDLPRPDLLVGPLAKHDFKVVENKLRAIPSNNLFGITARNGTKAHELATWLRSNDGQRELRRVSRRYHGGSHKLEPGDLKRARVPIELNRGHQ
jgi:hypothetical protein